MRLSEGERLDDEAVVGVDGKADGIGGDTIGGDADIYLSGIILGHTVLVVVKTEVTGARAVGICQHGVGDESQSLDGCGVVGHASLEQQSQVDVLSCLTEPETLKLHRIGLDGIRLGTGFQDRTGHRAHRHHLGLIGSVGTFHLIII